MNDLEKFIINSTNEFHLLRHYKFVDAAYEETLIDKPYWHFDHSQKQFVYSKILIADIEKALQTIGTKFDENIKGIENPKKLLEIIRNKFQELHSTDKIIWSDFLGFKTTTFAFDYKSTVGRKNCLNIDDIPNKEKSLIKQVPRSQCVGEDKIIINTISGIELSSTKAIRVKIVDTTQLPFFMVTAFPDCSLPDDLPDEKLVFVI